MFIKKDKRFFMLMLVLLLATTLVAAQCSNTSTGGDTSSAPDSSTTEQQAATEDDTSTTETEPEVVSGCDDALGCVTIAPGDPIKIASALVIAGPNETLGIDSQRGVEIAINDRSEVVGHVIELVAEDGGCSAEGGQTAATKIASDDSIVAVVGHNCSSSCTPAAPIYNDAGMTMISPSCTAPALTASATHVMSLLRTAHNDNIQGRVMAEFVYNELELRTAATIHDGSPYAEQLQQVFADVFVELGGEVTAQEAVNVGDTDMRPVLTSIATGGPDIIYYPIFIAEGGFITTQAKEIAGLENTVLAGADGMISPDFIAAAGDAAEGMYISGPDLGFTGGAYEGFLATHTEKYGEDPLSAFHAHAYDATNMIFDAIETVAQKDSDGNTVIGRQALRDALYATSGHDGITGNLSCNENGDCADPKIAVNQIQSSEYVPISGGAVASSDETATGNFTIGMMQIATHPALDAGRDGALKALADAGIIEGENLTVTAQNAEGDIATLATIAQSFVDEGVDLIIATSTPAGQAAFNAVKDLESPYVVFNVVTDPFAAGLAVGPDDHEAWITGAQALPPVEQAMSTMLEIVPDAKTIGIIWNPSEKNSEVATMIAREAANTLGVELVEGNIADSSEIQTAAEALVAQGIDAFFISTDSTVVAGFEALVKVANENQVPLFANDPASAERGAAAAVGVDYFQNGYDSGVMAAQILKGELPGDITIETQTVGILHINYDAATAQGVEFSADIVGRAAKSFGEPGAAADSDVVEGNFTIGMMQIATHPALDAGREGALKALADAGIVEGENLTVFAQNAEGDIATLATIAQSFVDDEVDMIIATSTPAGQAAFNVVKDLGAPNVIFNVVTDPFAAGLAAGPDDHEAWITGAQALPPVEQAMSTMLEIVPDAKTIGIIWNPSEKNSEVATMLAREAADTLGVELVEGNIADSSEIQTAAEALVAQGIDAFFISTDSTVVAGFEALVKVANENQVPLFANDPASAERGAAAAVGVDYYQNGYDSGELAARILKGESAGDLDVVTQAAGILHINYDAATAQGIEFPAEIEGRAAKSFGEK